MFGCLAIAINAAQNRVSKFEDLHLFELDITICTWYMYADTLPQPLLSIHLSTKIAGPSDLETLPNYIWPHSPSPEIDLTDIMDVV